MVSVPIPIDRLPDVVLGRDPGFSRPAAFAALAASNLPDREELLGAVLERKALAGVVAPRSPETDEYGIGQLVLTAPADAAIDVQLATGSGALTLAGQGRPAGSAVESR